MGALTILIYLQKYFLISLLSLFLLKMGYIALLYTKEAKSANLVVRDYKALHKTGSNSM